MCRFTGKDDPGYQQVGSELRRVTNKLRLEYKISQDKAQDIKSEHIGNYTCPVFRLSLLK